MEARMELAPLLALLAIVFVLAVAVSSQRRAGFDDALARFAASRGFEYRPGGGLSAGGSARGSRDGIGLVVDIRMVGTGENDEPYTRVRAVGMPPGLLIRPRGAMDGLLGGGEAVGDGAFDAQVVLGGEPPDRLLSRMDAETRAQVARFVGRGGRLAGGEWSFEVRGYVTDPSQLSEMLDAVHAVASLLARGERLGTAERLRGIAERDPVPDVRRRALRARLALGAPEAGWLRERIADPDDFVAILAAGALGEEGRAALRQRLAHASTEVRRAAALALARLPLDEDAGALEDTLWACLGGDNGVIEVIDALGAVGTVRSVPALQELSSGLLRLGERASRAREAVRAIQSRAVGAERGSLAIAEEGIPGALAVADGRAEVGARRRAREGEG